jgi:hypothetical protein
MSDRLISLPQAGFGQTARRDAWWAQSLTVLLVFTAFLIYAHWRILEGQFYYSGHAAANAASNYLAPFYSPLMFEQPNHAPSGHAWFSRPSWLPLWVSPAAFILIFPAGFRFTCYYYRGAYYKAFWADPPSCAVGEPRKSYWGEQTLPLIMQNVHRYFLYAALAFIVILSYDVWLACWFKDAAGWKFGVGVGTLLMAVNVVLIALYTCGCHSLRHLIGGGRDALSASPVSHKLYNCVTCLNGRHMLWAWCSLFSVALTDLYIRQCASGAIHDLRLF